MDPVAELAEQVAGLTRGRTVAVAESLTSGRLASALGAAPDASEWFRGAVVAYAPEVKFEVLGVTPGPVNTASCAREMAVGVRALLDADVAVAVTGVGGPGPDEGVGAGTFFLAVATRDGRVGTEERHVDGSPAEVVEIAAEACLRGLCGVLDPDNDSSEVWAPSPSG